MLTVEALVFKTPKQFQIDMILSRKYNTKQQEKCNKKLKVFDSQVSASKPEKPVSERDGISHGYILK